VSDALPTHPVVRIRIDGRETEFVSAVLYARERRRGGWEWAFKMRTLAEQMLPPVVTIAQRDRLVGFEAVTALGHSCRFYASFAGVDLSDNPLITSCYSVWGVLVWPRDR
jgi:hypothetical protein